MPPIAKTSRTVQFIRKGADGLNNATVTLYRAFPKNVAVISVATASSASYGFTKQSDGYYKSTNIGVQSSAAVCVVTVKLKVASDVVFECVVSGESTYDYGILGTVGQVLASTNTADTNPAATIKSTGQGDEVSYSHTYSLPAGTSQIYVKYRKDSSQDHGSDCLKFKVSAAASLAPPSANLTYIFATGALSGNLGGWSQSVPELLSNPIWVITALASSNTETDVIAPGDWSEPVIHADKGAQGATLRGLVWSNCPAEFEFQNGEGTEFIDYVIHEGYNYLCGETHNKSNADEPGVSDKWELGQHWPLFSTLLLLAERAKIQNLYVDDVVMLADPDDPNSEVLCKISGGEIIINAGTFRGLLQAVNAAGQGIVIDPNAMTMAAFNADGEECTTFEGNSYAKDKVIPPSSGSTMTLGSNKTNTAGDFMNSASSGTAGLRKSTQISSSYLYTDKAAKIRVTLSRLEIALATAAPATDYYGASISLQVQTFSDSACLNLIATNVVTNAGLGTALNESYSRSVAVPAGYHKLYVVAWMGGPVYGYAYWNITSASVIVDSYLARIFANGIAFTKNYENYCVVIEENGIMNLAFASNGVKYELTNGQMKANGSVQPRTMYAARVSDTATSTAAATLSPTVLSRDTRISSYPTVKRVSEGRYSISVPTGWGLNQNNAMVRVTGYGYCAGGSSPIKATVQSITVVSSSDNTWNMIYVETSDDASQNNGSFYIEIIKY